jgi:hypothetical protein
MRQERDAALQQVAELERLNDEILQGVPDREPRPELEPERDPDPEPEPPPQPARQAPPATPRGAGAARDVDDARQARLAQLRGVDCPYVLQNTPIIAVFCAICLHTREISIHFDLLGSKFMPIWAHFPYIQSWIWTH